MSPNVYDQAHLLASSLKNSTEYADYKLALARLKAEPGTVRIFRDFRRRQFDLQSRLLQGQDVPAAERERFAQLSEIIAQHGPISAFLGAEFRLSRLLGDIQKIIADAVELELGIGPEEEEDQAAEEAGVGGAPARAAETPPQAETPRQAETPPQAAESPPQEGGPSSAKRSP